MEQRSFTYNYVHLNPNEQIGLHQQPTWELTYVVRGSGERLIGDVTEPFTNGDLVLVPPEMPHCWNFGSNNSEPDGRILNITLSFNSELIVNCAAVFPEMSAAIKRILDRRNCAVRFTGAKTDDIKNTLLDMHHLDNAAQAAHIPRLLLLVSDPTEASVMYNYHKRSLEEKLFNEAKTYITCNVLREITLQDVASHIGMNRSSFCVFFKKATGKTFVNYLNSLRIDIACHLLMQQNGTISEVCYKSGFNDVPYFNRVFKRFKGMSPTEYMRCKH